MDKLRKIYFKFWKVPYLNKIAYFGQDYYSRLRRIKIKLFKQPELDSIYNEEFYNFSKEEVNKFADKFVEILIQNFNPKSVIDIGAGIGVYVNEFDKKKIKVIGYDGSKNAIKHTIAREGLIQLQDFREEFKPQQKYDLVLCIEVAEHIPTNTSKMLVKTLTKCGQRIIFTAAQKGQGGTDHINEQPKTFWITLFEKEKFKLNEKLTNSLIEKMKKSNVPWWIYDNFMIFEKINSF